MEEASTWSFSQSFSTQFQGMRSELESQVAAARAAPSPSLDAIQGLTLSLAKATKALADATGSLPTYDQKQFEAQLKSFEKSIEELRASSGTKPKFAFKRKPQTQTQTQTPTSSFSPSPVPAKKPSGHPTTPVTSSAPSSSSNVVLSSHTRKYLTRADLPGHPQQTDLSISNLDSCVVDLLPSKDAFSGTELAISALHARNLSSCIILLPLIQGSALLHDLNRCIIVLGCHQFRMHSSKKTDVFLYISSNPVIEDCSGIRFARYPSSLVDPKEGQKEQPPLSVQDFSHIRATPSPNFTIMDDADRTITEHKLVTVRDDPTSLIRLQEILPQ